MSLCIDTVSYVILFIALRWRMYSTYLHTYSCDYKYCPVVGLHFLLNISLLFNQMMWEN